MPTKALGPRTLDARQDRPDMRDRLYQPRLTSLPTTYPPQRWIARYLPAYEKAGLVLDQGTEGACTGFGLAALVNYVQFRRTQENAANGDRRKLPKLVSPRMLYHLARIYDEWPGEDYEGSSCRGAMKGWFHHGVCADHLWPYRKNGRVVFVPPNEGWARDAAMRPLGAYYRIVHDAIADLQSAIVEVGAIYVSACVHGGWQLEARARSRRTRARAAAQIGSVPTIPWSPDVKPEGGHAFGLVGYDDEGFILQNSWGPDWGFHGFARITYGDWLANGMDAWVATLGAPIKGDAPAIVLSSTRTVPASARELNQGLAGGITAHSVVRTTADHAWDLTRAARHALVLANDGRLAPQLLVDAADATDAAKAVAGAYPGAWLKAGPGRKKIAVYAHGGLNDLRAGLARTKVLGPCFEDNEVYPLFVCWQSGFLDSIKAIIDDTVIDIFGAAVDPRSKRAQGFFDDARNRALETFAIPTARPVWQQMKQNAVAASHGMGGIVFLADQLAALAKAHSGLEVHLVGHSAGSIVLGPLLELAAARGLTIGSLSLYAPACTVDFALDHYAGHIGTTVPAKMVSIDILSDKNERDDCVGPYGKSLLYLVSRALEDRHKTPILGLEAVWRPGLDIDDLVSSVGVRRGATASATVAAKPPASVAKWREVWAGWQGAKLAVLGHPQVWDGVNNIPATHGCFDNSEECIRTTIERIRGAKLKTPLPPLVAY